MGKNLGAILRRVHLVAMVVWALLAIPTVLVGFMSLYANFVGHASAYSAERAETKAEAG